MVFLVCLKAFISHFTRPQHPSRPFFQFLLLCFQSKHSCLPPELSFYRALRLSIVERTPGPPQPRGPRGHALLPPWEASSHPPQHRAETQMAAVGWRAPLQPRQMRALHFVSDTHTLLAVPETNGSLQTKKNKSDIWIWTLAFNSLVAACVQVADRLEVETGLTRRGRAGRWRESFGCAV